MLELIVKQGEKIFMRQPLSQNPLTIGRAADNDIRFSDPEISRHHCRIENKDGQLIASDLSRNGTLINGEIKKSAQIKEGDYLKIGPWVISIGKATEEQSPKTVLEPRHATKITSYDAVNRKLTTSIIELTFEAPGSPSVKRKFHSGDITIGGHSSCDAVISDPYVSRRHCRITNCGGQTKLIDLASTNGTFVGGLRIDQTVLAQTGEFSIGKTTVQYRLTSKSHKIGPSKTNRLGRLVGQSRAMREIFALIERIAPTDTTVCITGESGTGKELVAREIHKASPRSKGPFVAINCGALPPSLIEGQLFGHERGAFTGAVERALGLFEQAQGGTLFLDEIGEMPLDLQTRLLRVLESKTVKRIGGSTENSVNFRLVCATNRDIKKDVEEGKFRDDLFYRIFVVPIQIPPLRERRPDIAALATDFIKDMSSPNRQYRLTDAAIRKLSKLGWPGNVRELKNTIERTCLMADTDVIDAGNLKIETLAANTRAPRVLLGNERHCIEMALKEAHGNVSKASRKLGIARTTLQKKLKKHSIRAK